MDHLIERIDKLRLASKRDSSRSIRGSAGVALGPMCQRPLYKDPLIMPPQQTVDERIRLLFQNYQQLTILTVPAAIEAVGEYFRATEFNDLRAAAVRCCSGYGSDSIELSVTELIAMWMLKQPSGKAKLEAVRLLECIAMWGLQSAQLNVALAKLSGSGTPQNFPLGNLLLGAVIAEADVDDHEVLGVAHRELGHSFHLGRGCSKDARKAEAHYKQGAQHGDADAAFYAGICQTFKGNEDLLIGVKDYIEPGVYLQLGRRQGHGQEAAHRYLEAQTLFEITRRQGDPRWLFGIGLLQYLKLLPGSDTSLGIDLLREASRAGVFAAQALLSLVDLAESNKECKLNDSKSGSGIEKAGSGPEKGD